MTTRDIDRRQLIDYLIGESQRLPEEVLLRLQSDDPEFLTAILQRIFGSLEQGTNSLDQSYSDKDVVYELNTSWLDFSARLANSRAPIVSNTMSEAFDPIIILTERESLIRLNVDTQPRRLNADEFESFTLGAFQFTKPPDQLMGAHLGSSSRDVVGLSITLADIVNITLFLTRLDKSIEIEIQAESLPTDSWLAVGLGDDQRQTLGSRTLKELVANFSIEIPHNEIWFYYTFCDAARKITKGKERLPLSFDQSLGSN